MRQARMVGLQALPFGAGKIQRLQLAALERQQLAFGRHRFGVLFQLQAAAMQRLPCLEA